MPQPPVKWHFTFSFQLLCPFLWFHDVVPAAHTTCNIMHWLIFSPPLCSRCQFAIILLHSSHCWSLSCLFPVFYIVTIVCNEWSKPRMTHNRLQYIIDFLSSKINLWLCLGKSVLSLIHKYRGMVVLNIQGVVACQWW